MPEIFNIIQSDGIELINDVRANLGKTGTNSTGETSQSLRIQITQDGSKYKMRLFGRQFFMTVETGRGPTKPNSPQSDPSLYEGIKAWVQAKGVVGNPWAITKKIHESGTRLWRRGGREDIVTPAINEFQSEVSEHLLDAAADQFVVKIRELQW